MFALIAETERITILGMNDPKSPNDPIPYKLARLYHYDYNPRRKWLIVYSQWSIRTGKLHRRVFKTFNNIPDPKNRLIEARKWQEYINKQLLAGRVYDPEQKHPEQAKVLPPPTFANDYAQFIRAKTATLSGETIDAYNAFLLWWERTCWLRKLPACSL